ncbi:MAG: 50S ribosomal protein L33 [Desulfohalobiaceae bacterium]
MRVKVQMRCEQCKRKNYATTKNKKNTTGKLELKKYCSSCGTHVSHKESK